MLGHSPFYWNLIRKYIVGFSKLLSDIKIQRVDSLGNVVKTIDVPLTYAGKSKLFYYLEREDEQRVSITLPRVSFLITGMTPARERARNNLNQKTVSVEGMREDYIFEGSPWDFTITVAIWSKNMDDMLQIIEQVCAFFNPDYVMTIKEIPELDLQSDIPVIMNSVNFGFETEFGETEAGRRMITDMEFTLKGYLYQPIRNEGVINLINTSFHDKETQELLEKITLEGDELTGEITRTN